MTRRDRPDRMLLAFGVALFASCGGGGGDDTGAAANLPPTVTLAAPANVIQGSAASLTASAADADDGVAKVEFFDGNTLVGEDATSPYALAWTPTSAGSHTLTARATDTRGATTTSAAATVLVIPPPPPPAIDGAPPTVDADGAGEPRDRADRRDRRHRDGDRQRRRRERRIPDRRRRRSARRHRAAVRDDARCQPLSERPARRSRARDRHVGQRLGLVERAGPVRRREDAAERLHAQRELGRRPVERDRIRAGARRPPLRRRAGRHAARRQERRAAGHAVRDRRGRFGRRARPDRRRLRSRASRPTASSTSTRRARSAASRTTGSAASPRTATSPRPAAR